MESLKPTIPLVYQGVNVIVHMKIFVFSALPFLKIHMQLYYITVLVSVIERFNNYMPVSQMFRFSVFTIAHGRQPQGAQAPMNI